MATSGEHKAFCVLNFHTNKSVVSVQRHFRLKFGRDAPSGKSIRKWYSQFQDRGCICNQKSTGHPSIGEEAVERVRATFARSPQKSTYRAGRELHIPQKIVWRVLRKRWQMRPYRSAGAASSEGHWLRPASVFLWESAYANGRGRLPWKVGF
jgi:hypothetical protein